MDTLLAASAFFTPARFPHVIWLPNILLPFVTEKQPHHPWYFKVLRGLVCSDIKLNTVKKSLAPLSIKINRSLLLSAAHRATVGAGKVYNTTPKVILIY